MLFLNRAIVLILMLSLANMISSVQARDIPIDASAQTATQKELVRAKHIPKLKLFRSNPLRKSLILSGTDPDNSIDDEDYIVNSHRRPLEVEKSKDSDDELPEYVRWRLFLARQLALLKYKEKWA